jgi:hypothetical protein
MSDTNRAFNVEPMYPIKDKLPQLCVGRGTSRCDRNFPRHGSEPRLGFGLEQRCLISDLNARARGLLDFALQSVEDGLRDYSGFSTRASCGFSRTRIKKSASDI